jgi:ferredoxin
MAKINIGIMNRGRNMKKILILYFSGVGATKKVAELMQKGLSNSCDADVFSVEHKDIPGFNCYDGLIIGTPTYHATPARAIMNYIDALPFLDSKIPVFVFNTRGAASLNTNRLLSQKLYSKNIITVIDKQYGSPWSDGSLIAPLRFMKRAFKFEKNLEKKVNQDCMDFLELLIKDKIKGYIPQFNFGSIINAPNKLAGQLITFKIYVHKDKCIKCGRCIEECPHSAFFTDKDGYPLYASKSCENCYRCVHHCPNMALSLSKHRTPKKLLRY